MQGQLNRFTDYWIFFHRTDVVLNKIKLLSNKENTTEEKTLLKPIKYRLQLNHTDSSSTPRGAEIQDGISSSD